jgi:hypothetical protein
MVVAVMSILGTLEHVSVTCGVRPESIQKKLKANGLLLANQLNLQFTESMAFDSNGYVVA